jgi:hypothetical protein
MHKLCADRNLRAACLQVVIPFLQPTFLYGDGSMGNGSKPGSGQITDVQDA